MRRVIEPLAADADAIDLPAGLAVRTLARVAERQCRGLPASPPTLVSTDAEPSFPRLRRVDVLVAAALLVIVGGVAITAIYQLYPKDGNKVICQNNLRKIHQALVLYSDQHKGAFPKVEDKPPRNVAGIFIPMLREAGVLDDSVSFACRPGDEEPSQRRPIIRSVQELEERYARERDNVKTGRPDARFKTPCAILQAVTPTPWATTTPITSSVAFAATRTDGYRSWPTGRPSRKEKRVAAVT